MPKKRKAPAVESLNGPMAAALVSAGLGCATLGALTTLADASPEMADTLNWWQPVGPLSGKAGAATGVFLTSWLGLHMTWRRREIPYGPMVVGSSLLVAIGLVGTFPPFFQRVGERNRG